MKSSSYFVSLVIARIQRSLHALKEDLKQWVPQRTPVLVPIPISVERRARPLHRRHRAWGE